MLTPRTRFGVFREIRGRILGAALVLFGLTALAAGPALAGDAVLTRGDDEGLALTLEQLEALPQVTIVTENEFADGPVSYRGPLARDVIDQLDLGQEERLRFTAANDYYVEIPTSDFRRYDVILALEADGRRLSLRDKGPLWLMYPISDHEELTDPSYIHRLIWQVVRIEPV